MGVSSLIVLNIDLLFDDKLLLSSILSSAEISDKLNYSPLLSLWLFLGDIEANGEDNLLCYIYYNNYTASLFLLFLATSFSHLRQSASAHYLA